MNFLIGAIVMTLIVLAYLEQPYFFRYHSLRFVYRGGLLLYSRTFKIQHLANKTKPSRGHILLWMNDSGFAIPKAVEDGEKQYLIKEFLWHIGLRGDIHISALMRAKISWDNEENNVVVRGYTTWSYFSILVFAIAALFIPSRVEGNICGGAIFLICFLWFAILYAYQLPHLQSIGAKVAEYLSSDEE
jgi:hypothetical protein